jgi:hypothetical protein
MGFLRNLGLKRTLGPDYKDFKGNNEGVIGETARWFCMLYKNAINSGMEKYSGLRDPHNMEALESFMNDLIEARYHVGGDEDIHLKEKLLSMDNMKYGAYSFLLNLFEVEIAHSEYRKIKPQILMTILGSNFEDAKLPVSVVRGRSTEDWDVIELMQEYF